jgi:hypothetical protein
MLALRIARERNPVEPDFDASVRLLLDSRGIRNMLLLKVWQANHESIWYSDANEHGSLHFYSSRTILPRPGAPASHDRMSPGFQWDYRWLADAFYWNMRKLAREAVIFRLLGALMTGVVEFVIQRGRFLATGFVPPIELCVKFPSTPNEGTIDLSAGLIRRKPCVMDEKIIEGFSNSMCLGVLWDNGKCSRLSPEGEAAEARAKSIVIRETKPKLSWKDIPGMLAASVGFAFLLGFPGGLALWIFYRLVRFAIVG